MSSPHTEHGMPTKAAAKSDPSWWNTMLVVICIVLAYLVARQNDEITELRQDVIQEHLDAQIDMGAIEREATQKIAAAYAQGQRDALAALKPDTALQVAQLCQAWRYQRQSDQAPDDLADSTAVAAIDSRAGG